MKDLTVQSVQCFIANVSVFLECLLASWLLLPVLPEDWPWVRVACAASLILVALQMTIAAALIGFPKKG